jgi:hypothetical protein
VDLFIFDIIYLFGIKSTPKNLISFANYMQPENLVQADDIIEAETRSVAPLLGKDPNKIRALAEELRKSFFCINDNLAYVKALNGGVSREDAQNLLETVKVQLPDGMELSNNKVVAYIEGRIKEVLNAYQRQRLDLKESEPAPLSEPASKRKDKSKPESSEKKELNGESVGIITQRNSHFMTVVFGRKSYYVPLEGVKCSGGVNSKVVIRKPTPKEEKRMSRGAKQNAVFIRVAAPEET